MFHALPTIARRRSLLVRAVVTGLAAVAILLLASATACSTTTSSSSAGGPSAKGAAPTVKAWSGILIDRRTGVVLWQKAEARRLAPASTTKIMTALLVLEHVKNLDVYARVPDIPYPQKVGVDLRPGDQISIQQALRALMVKSANDAAITLATYVGGSEPGFVKLMNARAAQLGLKNTNFVNCRGTPRPGHYSSAADLATLGRVAMRDARFRSLVRIQKTVIHYPPDNAVPVENHNRLLAYAWADGIKTGATDVSKMVLVGSGKPGLVPLIVVTMHEPTREQEVKDALALFDWGSALYAKRPVVAAGDVVTRVPLSGGGDVALAAKTTLTAVVRSAAAVSTHLDAPASFSSRPATGSVVGSATYSSDGLTLGRVDLVAAAATAAPSPSASQ